MTSSGSTTLQPAQTKTKEEASYLKKVIFSCMVGNALEWYDFVLYGYFATTLGSLFFPSADPAAEIMATFGVFAAGFLMRPIGGIIFGYIGDKIGHRIAFMWAIYLMAIPTAIIGILPTYDQIGWVAPAALTLIRLIQGISMGGGFTGAMIVVVENADAPKRGYYGSWVVFSLLIGIFLGNAISNILSHVLTADQLADWGWRIPFILSLFVAYIGNYIKKQLHETQQFINDHKKSSPPIPIMTLLKDNLNKIAYVVGIELTLAIGFYMIIIFIKSFIVKHGGATDNDALFLNALTILTMGLVMPLSGVLSDRIGRKKVLFISSLGFAIFTYPLFLMLTMESFTLQLISHLGYAVLMGTFFAPIPATLCELFPAKIRCTGMAVAHSLSMAIFGGTAPYIALKLMDVTQDPTSPAIYWALACLVSALLLTQLKDKTAQPL